MNNIPRYWGYAKSEQGILVWRSSAASEGEAFYEARKAAERVSRYEKMKWRDKRPAAGDYPYGVTLREKLLREIPGRNGELQAFVTRNHAGAEVLNVRNVMFLDWDTPIVNAPPLSFAKLFAWLRRLFGGQKVENGETDDTAMVPIDPHNRNIMTGAIQIREPNPAWNSRTPESWEEAYPWAAVPELAAFMSWMTANPDWSVRIYKTTAGYRGIATHGLFNPVDENTIDLMQRFQCDKQYVHLCKRQESFRARLTPKGWRCKVWPNELPRAFKFYYPFDSNCLGLLIPLSPDFHFDEESPENAVSHYQNEYEEAIKIYQQAASPYATCRYLGTVGSGHVHPEVQPILDLHDEATQAFDDSGKMLA